MGQDEINLQVIAASGDAHEKKQALRVLNLLRKGKHWVLVTLLLSNVITNETLPIILDRSLGGGWPAVVASTVLIGKSPSDPFFKPSVCPCLCFCLCLCLSPFSSSARFVVCNTNIHTKSSLAKLCHSQSASGTACRSAP